eukprot:5780028-Amphidinium_carterae.2
MVVLRSESSHGFEGWSIQATFNAMKVRPPFDQLIHELTMACCNHIVKVVDIIPEHLTAGGTEASRRRPPPQPVTKGFEVP